MGVNPARVYVRRGIPEHFVVGLGHAEPLGPECILVLRAQAAQH
mgnify:CR=1 FL=1